MKILIENEFEKMLWKQLRDTFVYSKIPLYGNEPNPETEKKEYIHVLSQKQGEMLFSCKEIED